MENIRTNSTKHTMLRLNPTTLSQSFGQQLIGEGAYLRPSFENKLLPVICDRLNDPTLQRADSGSIGVGSALSLFLAAAKRKPKLIVEVGTYIGTSAACMGFGASMSGSPVQLVTCDINPCTKEPFAGLDLPEGSIENVMQKGSTEMFQFLVSKGVKIDMLHIDGRLRGEDLQLLKQLLKVDTLIALDDCEGDEKGHYNLDILRRSGLIQNHAFVSPFERDLFRCWNIESRSVTAFLIPIQDIIITRQ